MRPVVTAGLLLALCLVPGAARAQDLLVLTNGDRISGTLVSITGTTWTFRHAGGDLALAADQIAEFTAAGPIGVRLQDGSIAAGRVTATGGVMRFTAADGTSRTITPADLAAVVSPDDLAALRPVVIGFLSPFGKFWGARIGAGFANTSGNSRSRGFNERLIKDHLENLKGVNKAAAIERARAGNLFFEITEETTPPQFIKRARERCQLPQKVTTHSLRHTFAVRFLENHGDIYLLSQLMGHSSVKVPEIYLSCTPGLKKLYPDIK